MKDARFGEAGTCGTINLERSNFRGSGLYIDTYLFDAINIYPYYKYRK